MKKHAGADNGESCTWCLYTSLMDQKFYMVSFGITSSTSASDSYRNHIRWCWAAVVILRSAGDSTSVTYSCQWTYNRWYSDTQWTHPVQNVFLKKVSLIIKQWLIRLLSTWELICMSFFELAWDCCHGEIKLFSNRLDKVKKCHAIWQ